MNALLVIAGVILFVIGITWQITRWIGFWRLAALVGIGEAASAAKSLKRQSLAVATLAQELRELREVRSPWGRPPARQDEPSTEPALMLRQAQQSKGSGPFDDDAELARAWREASRRARRK